MEIKARNPTGRQKNANICKQDQKDKVVKDRLTCAVGKWLSQHL
jgi:hypothetical protein